MKTIVVSTYNFYTKNQNSFLFSKSKSLGK